MPTKLTTPALEQLFALRHSGASKDEWEKNNLTVEKRVRTAKDLRSILSEWDLPVPALESWVKQFNRAAETVYYGTDIDGRMIIFYDENARSIAEWASWDNSSADAGEQTACAEPPGLL